jgi:hypothetical protein
MPTNIVPAPDGKAQPISPSTTDNTEDTRSIKKDVKEAYLTDCQSRLSPLTPDSPFSYGRATEWIHNQLQTSSQRQWKPTLLRFGPISGIFSMVVAFSSIMVSLGVLVGSDGAAVHSWVAEPSIYLAICTAVANLSLRYACIQGVVVAWWVRALNGQLFFRYSPLVLLVRAYLLKRAFCPLLRQVSSVMYRSTPSSNDPKHSDALLFSILSTNDDARIYPCPVAS